MEEEGGCFMKIAILDDDKNELKEILKYTYDYFQIIHQSIYIDTFNAPNELLQSDIKKYDFLILDVLLGDVITGINLATEIRKVDKDIQIIFCSNSKDYSIEAYDVRAYTYILKPIDRYEYYRKLDNLMKELKVNFIEIEDCEHFKHSVNIIHINYIEVVKKKTLIHLFNMQIIKTSKPLQYWENMLSAAYFTKGYKGILVNVRNIKEIDKDIALMKNCEKICLSRKYTKSVKFKWYEYLDQLL